MLLFFFLQRTGTCYMYLLANMAWFVSIQGATAAVEESVNLPPGFQRITRSGGIRQQGLTYEELNTESDDSGGENNEEPDTGLG